MAGINQIGKKTKEWQRIRRRLVAELISTGEYRLINNKLYGVCQDCGKWKYLTFDHRIKRSQGGKHTKKNLDMICWKCHDQRDNRGDPMGKKPKSKKADWQKSHRCKCCKKETSMLICHHCGKLSV